jgi:tetratricopeptide (TPR) repeat protein
MILLFLFISFELDIKIDSLKASLTQNPQLSTVLELNKCYLSMDEFNEAINLLKEYKNNFKSEEKYVLEFNIADDYFFAGKILEAHEEYLKLVSRYPRSEIANDALERLYLIESARKNMILLKKLAHAICFYQTDQLDTGQDSLKTLLKSEVGAYAYYYLALTYKKKEDFPLSLSALKELNNSFPDHKIHNVFLLIAEIYLQLNNEKEAQEILENLIVEKPTSIYAVRAREMLREHQLE